MKLITPPPLSGPIKDFRIKSGRINAQSQLTFEAKKTRSQLTILKKIENFVNWDQKLIRPQDPKIRFFSPAARPKQKISNLPFVRAHYTIRKFNFAPHLQFYFIFFRLWRKNFRVNTNLPFV